MDMLKYAYNLGYQEATKEAEMTPAQMQAAQMAGGVGGGLAGAAGGSLLGKYLGEHVGRAFHGDDGLFSSYDPTQAQTIGAGLGGLLGAGAGGLLGSQVPRAAWKTTEAPHPGEERNPHLDREYGLGALPQEYSSPDPYAEQMYQQAMGQDYYGGY